MILPNITAILAIIISPIVSLNIAKKNLKASVNSQNRQMWINNLRDQITEFLSCIEKIDGIYTEKKLKHLEENEYSQKLTTQIDLMVHYINKIELMLNPNEKKHQELISLLKKLYSERNKSYKTEIISISQKIFKEEWERVKSLE